MRRCGLIVGWVGAWLWGCSDQNSLPMSMMEEERGFWHRRRKWDFRTIDLHLRVFQTITFPMNILYPEILIPYFRLPEDVWLVDLDYRCSSSQFINLFSFFTVTDGAYTVHHWRTCKFLSLQARFQITRRCVAS